MKKIIFAVLVILLFQKWGAIQAYFHTPAVTNAPPATVVLYGTSWCGYCAKARAFLAENHIAYQDYDIEKSIEGKRQFEALGGGGVPLILINDKPIRGYEPELMKELLSP